jgi:hypothetical protein
MLGDIKDRVEQIQVLHAHITPLGRKAMRYEPELSF